MTETGELIFETSLGGTRTIRIPNPAATINETGLEMAVTRFITANPFDETVGNLVSLKRANRVIVQREVLI